MNASTADHRFALPKTICFVIGAQKSGTSWLQSHFQQHPEVCVPGWKEIDYWNTVRFPFDRNSRLDNARARLPAMGFLRRLLRTPSMRRKDRAKQLAFGMTRGSDSGMHDGYAEALLHKSVEGFIS